jgi:hypothetical protein
LEFYSAMTQAFPKDPRIEKLIAESGGKVNPNDVPFEDRKELYIDHVESVFFKDLQGWFKKVEPIHKRMFIKSAEELDAEQAANGGGITAVDQDVSGEDSADATKFAEVPGWVIEIKGHHFHNSDKMLSELKAGKKYVLDTLITNLMKKKDVRLPVSDPNESDLFSYEDIGISFPTITVTSELKPKQITFDPTSTEQEDQGGGSNSRGGITGADGGGLGMGLPSEPGGPGGAPAGGREMAGSEAEAANTTFQVYEYNFVVQVAWTPRSEKERLEARAARLKAEEEAAAAKAAAEAEAAAAAEQ